MEVCRRAGGSPAKARRAERPSPNPSRKREGRKRGNPPAGREGRKGGGPPAAEAALCDAAALASFPRCGEGNASGQSIASGSILLPRLRGRQRFRSVDCRRFAPPPPLAGEAGWGPAGAPVETRQRPIAPKDPPPTPPASGREKRGGPPAGEEALRDAAAFASSPLVGGRPRFQSFDCRWLDTLPRLRGRPGGGLPPRRCKPGKDPSRRKALPRPLPQAGGEKRAALPPPKRALGDAAAFASFPACGKGGVSGQSIAGGPILLPRLRGRPGGGLLARRWKPRKGPSRREALPRPLPQAGGE